ncbi:MAG: hypothetical protein R3F34_03750 [Planctomycetota bacterium]
METTMQMAIQRGDSNPQREARTSTCPDHGYRLVPIHKVHGGERSVIGWTCPEPYCEHVVLDPRMTRDPRFRFADQDK